jgi:hypothetical protein
MGPFCRERACLQAQLFRAAQHHGDTDRVGPAQLADRFDVGVDAALAQR